jgi:hypothetical protein
MTPHFCGSLFQFSTPAVLEKNQSEIFKLKNAEFFASRKMLNTFFSEKNLVRKK